MWCAIQTKFSILETFVAMLLSEMYFMQWTLISRSSTVFLPFFFLILSFCIYLLIKMTSGKSKRTSEVNNVIWDTIWENKSPGTRGNVHEVSKLLMEKYLLIPSLGLSQMKPCNPLTEKPLRNISVP